MHFNLPYRITGSRWMPRLALGLIIVVSIIGGPDGTALAQTSNSMRIRAIGDSFAGIVDDAHTDAYLNPARVGDLKNRQIYMARLPATYLRFYYPDAGGLYNPVSFVFPNETVPGDYASGWYRNFTPYTLGFVTPISGSAKMSLVVDLAADGNDFVNKSDELRVITYTGDDRVMLNSYTYGREHSLYHIVADAAIGTGSPESGGARFGVRLRVEYDQMHKGYARVEQRIYTGYPTLSEMSIDYDYRGYQGEYENTSAELSIGLFRSTGFIAQAVLGSELGRESLDNDEFNRRIYDQDYDGNGRDRAGGTSPSYSVEDHEYQGYRSYDSVELFGRFGLRWSDRIRSFHRISWRESDGSGDGKTAKDYFYSKFEIEEQYATASFKLDGNVTGFATDNSIGVVSDIRENLQVAVGVRAVFQYEELEEDGDGEGSVAVTQGTSTNTIEAPYHQRAAYDREFWFLNLPIGLEWTFHRNVAWRFGSQIRASRLEEGGEIQKDLGDFDDPDIDDNVTYIDIDRQITYNTALYFSMGFGFTIWDRLSIDLLSTAASGSFNAADIVTAQVNYSF